MKLFLQIWLIVLGVIAIAVGAGVALYWLGGLVSQHFGGWGVLAFSMVVGSALLALVLTEARMNGGGH